MSRIIKLTAQRSRSLTIACSALFILLCLLHFLSQRPLWLDEISVLKNISKYSCLELFGPLDHAQAFPRFYLVMIKSLSAPLDHHPLALRFFPLVAMITAFFVWRSIFRKVFEEDWQYLLALFSFTSSHYCSYYAAELKPYSLDVLVVGLVTMLLLSLDTGGKDKDGPGKFWWIIFSPFLLLFSYAAVFIFWLPAYKALFVYKGKKRLRILSGFGLLTAISLIGLYYIDLRHSWSNAPLMGYWESYFVSTKSVGSFMETFWEGLRRLSTWWYGKGKFFTQWATFLIPFVIFGVFGNGFVILKRSTWQKVVPDTILTVLFLELFILGILRKYPFTGERITLFIAPFIFICVIRVLGMLRRFKWIFVLFLASYFVLLLGSLIETLGIYYNYYH